MVYDGKSYWHGWFGGMYPYFRKTPFTQFYSPSKQRQVSKNRRLVGHEVRQVGLVVLLLTLKWGQNGRIWAEGWFLRHNCSKRFFLFLDRHGPTWLASNPFRAMLQCNTVHRGSKALKLQIVAKAPFHGGLLPQKPMIVAPPGRLMVATENGRRTWRTQIIFEFI